MKLSLKRRNAILSRDGLTCRYCGIDLSESKFHFDHIHPKSNGGKGSVDNLGVSCPRCNLHKRDLSERAFMFRAQDRAERARKELEYWSSVAQRMEGRL